MKLGKTSRGGAAGSYLRDARARRHHPRPQTTRAPLTRRQPLGPGAAPRAEPGSRFRPVPHRLLRLRRVNYRTGLTTDLPGKQLVAIRQKIGPPTPPRRHCSSCRVGRRWSTLTDAATLDAAGAELPEHISRHAISSTETHPSSPSSTPSSYSPSMAPTKYPPRVCTSDTRGLPPIPYQASQGAAPPPLHPHDCLRR